MFTIPSIQRIAALLAILTTFGILVHDTKMDKATSLALAVPVLAAAGFDLGAHATKLGGEAHTHVERVSLANAVRDIQGNTPRIQPRDDHKKYHLQKHVVKGERLFDGYYLPV